MKMLKLDKKKQDHCFIFMGNPPYNLSSQNNGDWINNQIQIYKQGLNERNTKILADDYIKFKALTMQFIGVT